MTTHRLRERIEHLFRDGGGREYHGEAISQLEHALQSARLAEQDDRPASWIVAALLHDIGHLVQSRGEGSAAEGIDDRHEELGTRFLCTGFGPEVTEPIRLHVAAKRYLAAARPEYAESLSPASLRSLALQGGPMTAAERRAFEAEPQFAVAVAIREYDDRAKVVGLVTPPFEHYVSYLAAVLLPDPA